MPEQPIWFLRLDAEDLGILTWTDTDQPFHNYRFAEKPAFERVRHLFEEELRLLNADRMDQWPAAYQRVLDTGIRVENLDGSSRLHEFILHIEGDKAWMRHLSPGWTF
jgi:hypothetical protein